MVSLNWCLKQEKGIKLIEANDNLAEVYLKKAKSALNMLDSAIEKKEYEWVLDISYYAKYFMIYAVFIKCGIKSEIHDCIIEALKLFVDKGLLSENIYDELKKSKELRVGALYYNKEFGKEVIIDMANKTPDFCLNVEKVLEALSEEDIEKIRLKFGVRDA